MKRLIAIFALVALAGCATNSPDVKQAARIAITTYADIYQPAVLTYGKLPNCEPQVVSFICKDPAVLVKLKAADLAVTNSIVAAQPILDGRAIDAGELTAAISAIMQAQSTIAVSGALVTTQ